MNLVQIKYSRYIITSFFYSLAFFSIVACNENVSSIDTKYKSILSDTTKKELHKPQTGTIEYLIKDINQDKINDTLAINSSNKYYPILTIIYSSKKLKHYSTFSVIMPINSCYDGSNYSLSFQKENENIKRAYDFGIYMFTWGKHDNKLYFSFSGNTLKLIYFKYQEWYSELSGIVKNGKEITGSQQTTRSKFANLNLSVIDTLNTEILCEILDNNKKYPFRETKKFETIK